MWSIIIPVLLIIIIPIWLFLDLFKEKPVKDSLYMKGKEIELAKARFAVEFKKTIIYKFLLYCCNKLNA